MKPAKKPFKPQDLRTLLGVLLAIVLLGGGAVFYWGLGIVQNYSVDVNHRLADADASGKQIEELRVLKGQLAQSNSLVEKANRLFATPDNYQSRALADINKYADAAGLSIAKTSVDDAPQSHAIIVSLKQPVSYKKLITFLNNIEGNLPKMQISSISLGPTSSGGADTVQTGDIKIDISVR
jgi:hypothetical protein